MRSKRNRKALYEVIGRPGPGETAGYDAGVDDSAGKESGWSPDKLALWPTRPRMVQFNSGRLEMSVPYPLAITVFLCVVLLFLLVFRLGQGSAEVAAMTGTPEVAAAEFEMPETVEIAVRNVSVKQPTKSSGANRIVIQQCSEKRDLEPVQLHFADYRIETVIEKRGSNFFLVTKDTYDNPQRKGTDGALARKRIIEVGAGYKAPLGYDSFAPRLFSDAYGEKVKKF